MRGLKRVLPPSQRPWRRTPRPPPDEGGRGECRAPRAPRAAVARRGLASPNSMIFALLRVRDAGASARDAGAGASERGPISRERCTRLVEVLCIVQVVVTMCALCSALKEQRRQATSHHVCFVLGSQRTKKAGNQSRPLATAYQPRVSSPLQRFPALRSLFPALPSTNVEE